jgi:hypothetical protein
VRPAIPPPAWAFETGTGRRVTRVNVPDAALVFCADCRPDDADAYQDDLIIGAWPPPILGAGWGCPHFWPSSAPAQRRERVSALWLSGVGPAGHLRDSHVRDVHAAMRKLNTPPRRRTGRRC